MIEDIDSAGQISIRIMHYKFSSKDMDCAGPEITEVKAAVHQLNLIMAKYEDGRDQDDIMADSTSSGVLDAAQLLLNAGCLDDADYTYRDMLDTFRGSPSIIEKARVGIDDVREAKRAKPAGSRAARKSSRG